MLTFFFAKILYSPKKKKIRKKQGFLTVANVAGGDGWGTELANS
jgi:hypothetical protein